MHMSQVCHVGFDYFNYFDNTLQFRWDKPTWDVKDPVNDGINYQPQLVI